MDNKFPQIHIVFDRRKLATPTRQGSVEIRVTHNYKQKWISTGIRLYSTQWDHGKIVNCENINQISKVLEKLVGDIREVILDMIDEGTLDIYAITDRINKKHLESMTFLEFCTKRASIRKYGKKKDTQERYDRFLKRFSEYGRIKSFSDVRDDRIIAYDKYLAKSNMKACSRWSNYHRFLESFIRDAISEGLLSRNPYNWININKDKESSGIERCLTLKEFRQLKEASMPTACLEKVKDLFIFQTYTCLRYSDLARFDINNISMIDGMPVYRCKQKKTNKSATIPLLQPALDILTKYKGFLPIISNAKYNQHLKVVAQAAKLNIPLSTHWARHTGATLLLNEGVDMKIVTKICGHSSIKITEQVYAKLLDETVVSAVSEVKQKLE